MYFKIKKEALEHLSSDVKMKELIIQKRIVRRKVDKDLYNSMISIIIGQQISTKAASTIRERMKKAYKNINPKTIDNLSVEEIQSHGISFRKAQYIKDITKAFIEDKINYDQLNEMKDEEIIKFLIKFPGIGKWSAEMLLIFTFERENVISYLDLGIRRGIMRLYNLHEVSQEFFASIKEKFKPYNSTASIYLWELSK